MAYSVTPEHNARPRVSLARGGWRGLAKQTGTVPEVPGLPPPTRVHDLGPGWERIVAKVRSCELKAELFRSWAATHRDGEQRRGIARTSSLQIYPR